jgi:hypothetical protein
MMLDHSLNSRDRLKLLLDVTNTLVSNLECRDVRCQTTKRQAEHLRPP